MRWLIGLKDFTVEWKILHRTKARFSTRNGCTLCNLEKMAIARADKDKMLNTRTELQAKCPHNKGKYFWWNFII